jgi:hypothetical protein
VFPPICDNLQDTYSAHQVGQGFKNMKPHKVKELIWSHTKELANQNTDKLINEGHQEEGTATILL